MKIVKEAITKLCHAKVGQIVLLIHLGEEVEEEGPYMVCAEPGNVKVREERHHPDGLYAEPRRLFLVHMETGLRRNTPNLSSKVVVLRDAALVLEYVGD